VVVVVLDMVLSNFPKVHKARSHGKVKESNSTSEAKKVRMEKEEEDCVQSAQEAPVTESTRRIVEGQ
jgi:hypothetical protein